MIRIPVHRLLATATMAILLAVYIRHDYAKWGQRGREAFLTYQASRFDRYMATPHTTTATVIGVVIVVGIAVLIYEMFAAAFSKLTMGTKPTAIRSTQQD